MCVCGPDALQSAPQCASVPLQTLPPVPLIRRWLGQPVKALLLPTSCFTSNKRGYPVLPKPHQDLLTLFLKQGVQVGLRG